MSFIFMPLNALMHMDRGVMDYTVAQEKQQESANKFHIEDAQCLVLTNAINNATQHVGNLLPLTEARIENISKHISNLNIAEERTTEYMTDNALGKLVYGTTETIDRIDDLRADYMTLLQQHCHNINHLKSIP